MSLLFKLVPHSTPQPYSAVQLVNDLGETATIHCHTRSAADLLIICLTLNAHDFTIHKDERG